MVFIHNNVLPLTTITTVECLAKLRLKMTDLWSGLSVHWILTLLKVLRTSSRDCLSNSSKQFSSKNELCKAISKVCETIILEEILNLTSMDSRLPAVIR